MSRTPRTRPFPVTGAIVGALIVAVGAGVVWRCASGERPSAARTIAALDVGRLRAQVAERVARAQELARTRSARSRSPAPTAGPRSKVWDLRGTGPTALAVGPFTGEAACTIGPREVCDALAPLVAECQAGDARTCLAVGQFLADTPPRLMAASAFFVQACRLDDADGCARMDALEPGTAIACEADPWACSWRATRANDRALHAAACASGAAESCAALGSDDRQYLEAGCQLGDMLACAVLAERLSPACDPAAVTICLPPDAEAAARAREMACAAGLAADGDSIEACRAGGSGRAGSRSRP